MSKFSPTLVSAAVAAAMMAAPAAQAVEYKLSGQVNKMILFADNGTASNVFFTDNDASSTRFRFTGEGEVYGGLKAGIVWENEYQSNPSNKVDFENSSASETSSGRVNLEERKAEVYFKGAFGQATLGQGDGACNGATEVDLSGTALAHYAGYQDFGGGISFDNGTTVGQSMNQNDFFSRYDRLRYDSPALGPVKLALSVGDNDDDGHAYEACARLSTEIDGGIKLKGAFGYGYNDDKGPDATEIVGGSVSVLFAGGINATVSITDADLASGRSRDNAYVKVGYKMGKTAVSIDYGASGDVAGVGVDGEVMGLGVVHTPSKFVDVYAAIKQHSIDGAPGGNPDDVLLGSVGSRVKF